MTQPEEEIDWQQKSVLIAEDEDSNYKYLEIVLRHTGIRIFRARNGHEVLSLYQEHPGMDLILMDIKMPELDGLETTRQIRQVDQQIPIVALTAYAMSDDRDISLQAGCNDYIAKPVRKSRIISVLKQYLEP